MRANGNTMRSISIILTLLIVFVYCLEVSFGGNKWMMEKSRDELLALNTKLLQSLEKIQKDQEMVFSGSVVFRNGNTIIRIHRLQNFISTPVNEVESSEIFNMNVPYKVLLREEPIPEVPVKKNVTNDKDTSVKKQ